MRLFNVALVVGAILLNSSLTRAHEANDARIEAVVSTQTVEISWGVALADLDLLINLDNDLDGSISRRDIDASRLKIESAMLPKLRVSADGQTCVLGPADLSIATPDLLPYLYLEFEANCGQTVTSLLVSYDFMFDLDYSHQAIIRVKNGESVQSQVAGQSNRNLAFELGQSSGLVATLLTFFASGLDHIVEGYDHVAFLLVLAFSVLIAARRENTPLGTRVWQIAMMLTGFTVAHAVSITLAQFNWVVVPSRLVESFIALSIVVAAIDVWKPFLGKLKWYAIFGFGLVHGLGFASSLGNVGLSGSDLFFALLGFNVGIEVGQIVLAITVVGLDHLLSYRPCTQQYLSTVCVSLSGTIGLYWFVVRALSL